MRSKRMALYREALAQRRSAIVADLVAPKVDAREGRVDLQNRKRNTVWSMVTGGETSS